MFRYAINRMLAIFPLLVGLSVVAFIYVHLIPGDPVQAALGPFATADQVIEMRHGLGLDRPLAEQYLSWVGGLFSGNLGITFGNRREITPILLNRIPATLELALGALFFAVVIGLPAGIFAGLKKNTRVDYLFSLLALGGLSMPVFWAGTLLLIIFGVNLKVMPTGGYVPFSENPRGNLTFLLMPAFALGFSMAPFTARMSRASVIETMQEPFVFFAQAKGLKGNTVFLRYVLRHAMCQIVVVLAMEFGHLLSGGILIEQLFLWPGMGRIVIGAVQERDYFMLQACILIYAGLFLVINLLADVIHAWMDPRIQLK